MTATVHTSVDRAEIPVPDDWGRRLITPEADHQIVEHHPGISFWKTYRQLRQKRHGWHRKRIYRIDQSLDWNTTADTPALARYRSPVEFVFRRAMSSAN